MPVVVETVAAQEWTDALRALGTVHAREAVTITAKVSETVQQVHFESGQQVARGAPLVTLSGQQQQAALASAEAALVELLLKVSSIVSAYPQLSELDLNPVIAYAGGYAVVDARIIANRAVASS